MSSIGAYEGLDWESLEYMRSMNSATISSQVMTQDDANGDEVLSIDESHFEEDMFNRIDADSDGQLTTEELQADWENEQQKLMEQLSTNAGDFRGSRSQLMMFGPPQMEQASAEDVSSQIMSNDDANEDGVLSIEETPLSEEMFSEIDADGDGEISMEELQQYISEQMEENQEMMPPPPPPPSGGSSGEEDDEDDEEDDFIESISSSIIDENDADGDGVLSLEETSLAEEMFNEIDADGDGQISMEELQQYISEQMEKTQNMAEQMPPPPPPPPMGSTEEDSVEDIASSILEEGDVDESGGLSIDETSLAEEDFSGLDTNGDGEVSLEELQAHISEQMERMREMLAEQVSQMAEDMLI